VQQKALIMRAEEVQVGDMVWELDPVSNTMDRTTVAEVSRELAPGLYNPHTLSGNIVVEDIAALTFTNTLPKQPLVHSLVTAPGALLYWLSPTNGVAEALNSAILRVFGA
jgi:hypothetical protein